MPAWVAQPHVAMSAGRRDDLQKEWQESRAVIGRLDGTLVDLRKYGFGLASGLLTANGLIFGVAKNGVSSLVIAVVVSVTMVLVAVLFVVDQYYRLLQWGATSRAGTLERYLSLGLSTEILAWAHWEGPSRPAPKEQEDAREYLGRAVVPATRFVWKYLALIQYGSFVVVAAFLGTALMGTDTIPITHVAGTVMWIALFASFSLMVTVRWLAGQERKDLEKPRPVVGDVRAAEFRLSTPLTVKPGENASAELTLGAGETELEPGCILMAVFSPEPEGGLTIVGGSVSDNRHIRIELQNSGSTAITPTLGADYAVFVC